MSIGTMTSKGQITVPKDVRDDLGLAPGARVSFTRNADGDFVLHRVSLSLRDLRGVLRHDGAAVSLAAMEAAIAEGAVESGQ